MLNQIRTAGRFLPSLLGRRSMCKAPTQSQVTSYSPNSMEKKFLVWTGKYKTVDDIPNYVSAEVMDRCRNKMRIRIANIMMALTVIGCVIMVYSGKSAAKQGDSVTKQNLEWHKRYNELHAPTDTKK